MSLQFALSPIPWAYENSDFGSVWVWDTPHFVVTVNGDDRSCYFQVADKSANPSAPPRPLLDGRTPTFEQTEQQVREAIGKAYSPALDYGRFSGAYATTFRIADGKSMDLGVFTGQEVDVVALGADGAPVNFTGVPRVEHYDFLLDVGESTLRISPSYVVSVTFAGQRPVFASQPRVNRTFQGRVEFGCTGRPGFLGGTVEHSGIACPVHEQ